MVRGARCEVDELERHAERVVHHVAYRPSATRRWNAELPRLDCVPDLHLDGERPQERFDVRQFSKDAANSDGVHASVADRGVAAGAEDT